MRRGIPVSAPKPRPDWVLRLFVGCLTVFFLALVVVGWLLEHAQ
jgi:hypothetical protein